MGFNRAKVQTALDHLSKADPVLARVIQRTGPFSLKLRPDPFEALVSSIISQQISGAAARSISRRLRILLDGEPTPEALARQTPEQLRSAGVSPQKARYLLDLGHQVLAGTVRVNHLRRLPDDEVIAELVQVKGIGVWTAQMFLMFSLGRWDVFPHDDLGIRMALRKLYRLRKLPDKKTGLRIAAPWRPYATVASWYCWRSLELED